MRAHLQILVILLLLCSTSVWPEQSALDVSIQELRDSHGAWLVITEFLNEDGSIAKSVEGNYQFDWVVPDRVLQGRSSIPELDMNSAILFYVREADSTIEMVSVGKDGGETWVQGNHQVFRRP